MKKKSRNLSVAEYFVEIQKEYLIADFRRKVYYSPKDKLYYERVMGHKKEKIEDIAKRNHLSSIFNDQKTMDRVRNDLFNELGNPKFYMNETDIQNYYATGNEFSYKGEIWILDQVNMDGRLTLYNINDQRYAEAGKCEVCRIL